MFGMQEGAQKPFSVPNVDAALTESSNESERNDIKEEAIAQFSHRLYQALDFLKVFCG